MSLQPLIQVFANHQNLWNNFKSVLFNMAFKLHFGAYPSFPWPSLFVPRNLSSLDICQPLQPDWLQPSMKVWRTQKAPAIFGCCLAFNIQ